MNQHNLNLETFEQALQRISTYLTPTPLIPASGEFAEGKQVHLKLECLQPTGAFKLRGALNSLLQLTPAQRGLGVVCASTGNHARALAYAGQLLGVPVTVCMSELVPQQKVKAVKRAGANVEIVGRSQDDAQVRVNELCQSLGVVEVPPFDALATLVGQGTMVLELKAQLGRMPDTLFVPVSGGGLVAGVAACAKLINPNTRVIGVSMLRGAAMHASLQAGHPVEVEELETLADSLGGGIGLNNRYTFDITRQYVDELILLPEETIAEGMRAIFYDEQLAQEGAGATGYILARERPDLLGETNAIILSGRNVDPNQLMSVLKGELPYGGDL